MIPEGFITNLLDRADIGDVIGRYMHLKKAGRNLMACCPFHKEKTPSFSVSPTKQIYKCFGCGASGNAIGFLMAYEGLEFPDAVRKLAGFYGMVVPEDQSPERKKARELSRTLTDYMGEAAAFYTTALTRAPRVIDYLKDRAILSETAERFGLGYSPDEWHALKGVFAERYGAKELEECGLVNVKNDRRYDAFRGRLMFPIRNVKGQVIGFGARTLNGDEQPKYLNSPETPIYHKGSELYGLYEGREAIHQKGRAIVCEGYMDVIQLSQAGFTESVAALGTSITSEHVHKLFKLADTVYFSFDGDGAGRKAARRALEATLPVITDVQKAGFVILPPEHDPDSLIKAEGASAYEEEIKKAYTLTAFMKHVLLEGKELQYAEERAKIVAEAKPMVLAMQKAPILQLTVIKELAGIARLTADEIQRQYGLMPAAPRSVRQNRPFWESGRGPRGWRSAAPAVESRVRVKDMRERMLQCFLAYPDLLTRFSHPIEEEFLNTENAISRRIVELWQHSTDEDGKPVHSAASLLERLKSSSSLAYYRLLLGEELTIDTPAETALHEVRRAFIDLELERIKARIEECANAGKCDEQTLRPLMSRHAELRSQLEEIAEEERLYRQRVDTRSRYERQEQLAQKTKKVSAVPLSDNPIVRELQQYLRGSDSPEVNIPGEDTAVAVSAPTGTQSAARAAREALEKLSAQGAQPSSLSTETAPRARSGWSVPPSEIAAASARAMPGEIVAAETSPAQQDDPWADLPAATLGGAVPEPDDDIPWVDPDTADLQASSEEDAGEYHFEDVEASEPDWHR